MEWSRKQSDIMGIATTVLEKNQQLWAGMFGRLKDGVFGSKKKQEEKPRDWKH